MTPQTWRLKSVLLALSIAGAVSLSASPVLLWDPNPDPNVAGYKVYSGTLPRVYSTSVDVSLHTSNSLVQLNAGITYYFAVTAYTDDGLESAFSDEVSFTPRVDGLLSATALTGFTLQSTNYTVSFTARAGQQCRVVASSDFETWHEVYSLLMLTNGTVRYVDRDANSAPMRFYRTVVTPP